ncbi:MAG TPA: SDR family NAD(P)-dependent oxidoreductase, partial [Ktedonobacterales bacterium]|nr:SDR family NAD(P)-dependent oxidoreductase [Ktedonobacterales bacterium]
MGRLSGRVALVTGAGRGIGAATARRLAEEGARLILADLDVEGCERVAAEIKAAGSEAVAVRCDVSSEADAQQAVTTAVETFGQLDILVNNAGILRDNLLFKMSEDD